MAIKSENDSYRIIEALLRKATAPMTCNDLWDADMKLRELEKERGADAVSDMLGFMWRKGLLVRYPAPRTSTSFARFAYTWKEDPPANVFPIKPPDAPLVHKPNLKITETKDGIVIELDSITELEYLTLIGDEFGRDAEHVASTWLNLKLLNEQVKGLSTDRTLTQVIHNYSRMALRHDATFLKVSPAVVKKIIEASKDILPEGNNFLH